MSKSSKNPSSKKSKKAKQATKNNTWLWVALAAAVILIGVIGFTLFRPGGDQSTTTAPLAAEISVDDAYAKYQEGVFVLDVRTPEEWVEYHAPNTTLIPLDELEGRLDEVPRDQEIVVVCRSGNRSQVGRDILLQAGYPQVASMAGGLRAWQAQGYPTTTGP